MFDFYLGLPHVWWDEAKQRKVAAGHQEPNLKSLV